MSEFTKGKWIIDRDGSAIFSDSEDCYVAELSPANSDEQVAANARLIAAAPEMYEAINECADTLQAIKEIDDCKDTAELYQLEDFVHYLWELVARIDGKED